MAARLCQAAERAFSPAEFDKPIEQNFYSRMRAISPPQVCLPDVFVVKQSFSIIGQYNRTGLQHISLIGNLERHKCILLNQYDGNSASTNLGNICRFRQPSSVPGRERAHPVKEALVGIRARPTANIRCCPPLKLPAGSFRPFL